MVYPCALNVFLELMQMEGPGPNGEGDLPPPPPSPDLAQLVAQNAQLINLLVHGQLDQQRDRG